MVALGESTTAGGWSTAPDRCWVPLLGALINDFQTTPMRVVNSGIGANLIARRSPAYEESGKPAADERLDKHVLSHDPDLLAISYGLNDARGGTPLAQFCEDLALLVGRVRQRGNPLILLLGPYFMTDFTVGGKSWSHADLPLFRRFNAATAEVAAQLDCLLRRSAGREAVKRLGWSTTTACTKTTSATGSSPTASSRCWPRIVPAWRSGSGRPSGAVRGGETSRC